MLTAYLRAIKAIGFLVEEVEKEKWKYDVFVCYAREDREIAKILTEILGQRDLRVFLKRHRLYFTSRDSFINHVMRHIKAQLSERQLQPSSPNIIVIQGHNWIIFGLGEYLHDIKPLYMKIKEFLNKKKEEHLSGVALFSREFGNSVFILNEHVREMSKLDRNEVEKLGMRYLG